MRLLYIFLFCLLYSCLSAQSTGLRVYQIFQEKCVSCHDNASPEAGLDLEGSGATLAEKAQAVYNNIVSVSPSNGFAAEKGYQYIYPGRADKSFIFRKINESLEPTINLEGEELNFMPPYGSPPLTNTEKELIRQWIAYGAPAEGQVVSEALIEEYYTNNGMSSFPDGPPEAPAASEGFQIKMGPFYIEPGGEIEYFQKYQLDLPEDVDVDRIDIKFSSFSHHFIMYDYATPNLAEEVEPGYRLDIEHNQGVGIITSVAEPTDLRLPQGTAYFWDKDVVLDLNSHYINYSATLPYQAEVYVNIYTKPSGTALQEMHVDLIPNPFIPIPNNGNEITHTATITFPAEIWVWTLGGHTHQYGTGYKIWKRTPAGQQGELLYDGSCAQGIPGCISPFFDYQHIPARIFETPIYINLNNGLIHEATWINDGPESVNWGPTSDDEMMLFGMYYLTDTTGLGSVITSNTEVVQAVDEVLVYPNPTDGHLSVSIPSELNEIRFSLFDNLGRQMVHKQIDNSNSADLYIGNLPKGIYFYRIEDKATGQIKSGKLLLN